MRSSKMMLSLVAAMTLLVASTVFAAGPCGNCPGFGGGQGMGPGAGLAQIDNLTKEQKDQFNGLRTEFLKKQEALRTQKAQKRIELMDLASKSPQDEAVIQKKKEEIWAVQDQMKNEGRAFGTKIRALLTPEQREKLGVTMGGGCGFGGQGGCGAMGRGAGCCGGGGRGMMSPRS